MTYRAEAITSYNFSASNEYALGESDFNDQILIDLCRRQGLKMVTDDGDFKGQDVSVITRNQRLLT